MKYELAKLRKTRGFSQAKLAEITGLTQQSIFRIENGERDIDISEALRIASALRCKIKDIVVCNTEEQSAFDDLDNLNRIAAIRSVKKHQAESRRFDRKYRRRAEHQQSRLYPLRRRKRLGQRQPRLRKSSGHLHHNFNAAQLFVHNRKFKRQDVRPQIVRRPGRDPQYL